MTHTRSEIHPLARPPYRPARHPVLVPVLGLAACAILVGSPADATPVAAQQDSRTQDVAVQSAEEPKTGDEPRADGHLVPRRKPAGRVGAGGPRRGGGADILGGPRIWWNQAKVASSLGLDAEARKSLDDVLAGHLEARRSLGRSLQAAKAELSATLVEGRWDDVEAARSKVADASAQLALAEADLMEKVLRRFDVEQRRTLRDEFPRLLARPWLFGGAGQFAGGRPGVR